MSLFPEPWRPDAAAIAALPDRFPAGAADRPALLAACPPTIRAKGKAAQWREGVYRAWGYLAGRARDPGGRAQADELLEQALAEGPDFTKVRRSATFAPVPIIAYSPQAAREIMRQARQIERETYAARAKGEHGGGLGRLGLQLLEWFAFTLWPKSGRFGMVPSLAHVATGARMSRASVVEAMKRLEQFGFLTIQRRRKRVETPLGVKVTQAASAYTLGLARGLGALALAAFGKRPPAPVATPARPPESTKTPAIRNELYPPLAERQNWLPKSEYEPLLT